PLLRAAARRERHVNAAAIDHVLVDLVRDRDEVVLLAHRGDEIELGLGPHFAARVTRCAHQDRARLRRDRSAERRPIHRPARRARGHEHGRQAEAQATAARSGAIPSGAVYATLLATMASHAALATGGGVGRSQMPWPRLMAPGIASQARLI